MRCIEKGYYRITYKIHPEGAIDEKQTICPECTSGSSNIDALRLFVLIHESAKIWICFIRCFSGETTYNTYNTIGFIDAIFFYVVGPVSSELVAFVVSYNLNQQSQTHSATSAKQGINLFAIMIILQIATVLIIALTATNVLKYEFGFIASCLMAIAAGIAVSYTTPAKK